eukprot:4537985-Pleurochrysis_carterae.AAC.2
MVLSARLSSKYRSLRAHSFETASTSVLDLGGGAWSTSLQCGTTAPRVHYKSHLPRSNQNANSLERHRNTYTNGECSLLEHDQNSNSAACAPLDCSSCVKRLTLMLRQAAHTHAASSGCTHAALRVVTSAFRRQATASMRRATC